MLVEEKLRPYFMAEFLKSLGCRMTRAVASPGDKAAAGAGASSFRIQRPPQAVGSGDQGQAAGGRLVGFVK